MERKLCLATIQFVGKDVFVDSAPNVANQWTISLDGDEYTFYDPNDKITDVFDKPVGCQVHGVTGGPHNKPVTIECDTSLIESITLDMGNLNDSVTLQSARDAVQILGGEDDDSVLVGEANLLTGALAVDGGGGSNSLTLDDSSDLLANTVTITSSSVGAGAADNYFGIGGSLVAYSNLSDLTINLGAVGNTATVESAHAGSTLLVGGAGSDVLVVDDTDEAVAHDYEISNVELTRDSAVVVSYNGVETLDLYTGSAGDTVVVGAFGIGLPATINVLAGSGVDTFEVNLGTPGAAVVVNLDGGDGIDFLFVNGSNSNDEIMVNDQGEFVAGDATIVPIDVDKTTVDGGDGPDMIDVSKSPKGVTVFGGGGDDEIIGGSGDDVIFGGDGNDMINTGDGNDVIFGGGGNDMINTGDGNDVIFGGGGNDMVNGGAGDDEINTGDGNDVIFGGGGNDMVNGGAGDDEINTGDGNDVIFGGGGNDMVNGGAGDDEINTGDGNDVIFGGGGNDMVNGGAGDDEINTGDGNDVIFGGGGNDMVNTGDGNDIIFGGEGDDTVSGGVGDDLLIGGAGDDVLVGGGGNDIYIFGGDDLGSDQIIEAPNVDTDTLDFSSLAGAVTIDLAILSLQTVSPGILDLQFVDPVDPTAIEFTGVENVVGSAFADEIFGNSRDNELLGADLFDFAPTDQPAVVTETQWVLLDFDSETDAEEEWDYQGNERDAIQQRLEADYAEFHFSFTQDASEIPTATYATIFFNKTATVIVDDQPVEVPGKADELDFRNLNPGGTAAIDVSLILGESGEPELNSDNVVAGSATIAAHELGHLVGLRHADSFGPIGFGIHNPPGTDGFRPPYPGLANAFETAAHLMASPDSVGTSLTDTVGHPYFSERSAIKLAFAEFGAVEPETTVTPGDHATPATAQPVALSGLYTPNTLAEGLNSVKQFAVEAVDVTGTIELEAPGGVSESDVYEFAGHAGDVFTFEIMSVALDRITTPIDPILRVLDSTGAEVAFFDGIAENDDSFEPPDSLLVDFPVTSDGTFFLEVDTFTFAGDPDFAFYCGPAGEYEGSDACSDTDTGEYELFVYRFDAGNETDLGDLLVGRDGNDTLQGGFGDDTLDGGAGDDVMDGGEGDDTFVIVPGSVDRVIELNDASGGIDLLDFSGALSGISIDLSIDDGMLQVVDGAANMVAIEGVVEDLIGSLFADSLSGNAEDNVIDGLAGNDTIFGAAGDDTLTGDTGADAIDGGTGKDTLVEVRDADMTLSDSSLTIGSEGSDSLNSIEQARLTGGAGKNTINASAFTGKATLLGLGDNDNLSGGSGDDFIDGGDGNDQITGGNGSDVLLGGSGDDHATGGAGRDVLIGGQGIDRLVGGADDDILVGGATIYDATEIALRQILNEWNSTQGYLTRVANLRSGVAGSPPAPFSVLKLDATTILDDGAVDDLTGSADKDWFLLFASVDITDQKPDEEID